MKTLRDRGNDRAHRRVSRASTYGFEALGWLSLSAIVALGAACTGTPGVMDASDASLDAPGESAVGDAMVSDDAAEDAPARDVAPPPPPPVELGRHAVTVGETRRIVPSAGLPMETPAMNSNNNLDVLRHSDGRVYLAWRTAPDHFASDRVVMNVVSSTDERTWRFETRFMIGRDVREPRLLSLNGSVFLYLARLGTSSLGFDPQGMSYAERRADGTWTPLVDDFYPGRFIAWRTRTERGRPYMLAYKDGQNIYLFNGQPMDVHFLTTDDGRTWRGVNPAMPVVYRGGGSETDMVLGDDGTLFAVIRNEAGDDTGWGSLVCRAPASALSQWNCRHDPRKYDSPYMFWYDGEAYLIGRRNITATGNYDLSRGTVTDRQGQTVRNQIAYSGAPKRCSLWRYDQATDRIVYILDLPSKGDTCFPAVLTTDTPGTFAVYNYSSDVDGPEIAWSVGQRGPTYIYRTELRFAPRTMGP